MKVELCRGIVETATNVFTRQHLPSAMLSHSEQQPWRRVMKQKRRIVPIPSRYIPLNSLPSHVNKLLSPHSLPLPHFISNCTPISAPIRASHNQLLCAIDTYSVCRYAFTLKTRCLYAQLPLYTFVHCQTRLRCSIQHRPMPHAAYCPIVS